LSGRQEHSSRVTSPDSQETVRGVQVQLFRSATVVVRSDGGTQILCDLWLTNGAYIGSWHHWPRLEGDEFESVPAKQWDAVYISHLHPDHFDRRFVADLGRRQPHCRVVIPAFGSANDAIRALKA